MSVAATPAQFCMCCSMRSTSARTLVAMLTLLQGLHVDRRRECNVSSIPGANRRVAVKAVEQSWEALRFEEANVQRCATEMLKALQMSRLEVDGGLPANLLVEAVKQEKRLASHSLQKALAAETRHVEGLEGCARDPEEGI